MMIWEIFNKKLNIKLWKTEQESVYYIFEVMFALKVFFTKLLFFIEHVNGGKCLHCKVNQGFCIDTSDTKTKLSRAPESLDLDLYLT